MAVNQWLFPETEEVHLRVHVPVEVCPHPVIAPAGSLQSGHILLSPHQLVLWHLQLDQCLVPL